MHCDVHMVFRRDVCLFQVASFELGNRARTDCICRCLVFGVWCLHMEYLGMDMYQCMYCTCFVLYMQLHFVHDLDPPSMQSAINHMTHQRAYLKHF